MRPSCTLQSAVKTFGGVCAVDNVTLSFPFGMITGIIGPNGSGKSTIVHGMSGVVPFDSGIVHIGGIALPISSPYDAYQRGICRTFQEVRVFEHMTVRENLLLMLAQRTIGGSLCEHTHTTLTKKVDDALSRVGLDGKQHEYAEKLSYGQRKLLEIARILLLDASAVVLFDEPFAGLFKVSIEKVREIILELKDQGKAIVLIEHNMELIRELSDHLVVMDGGIVLAQGIPHEVLSLPRVIEAYIGK
ncbi:ABC transporter ATP-binding protein [Candidatus Uhrbacteria bacterium]|nr:ABC transporter ATP-binding protein [Candidatus Uhrbacteria bacterium]